MGSGPDLWFAVGFVPIVQTLPKWHICPNLGRICRCNGVFQCFQFIHALTFGLGQHIFRLGKAVLSQLGGAFAVFSLYSHSFNSSSKIFLRNSSTISAARFCISVVVWVGVLGERRPGMSQDSRQSLYIYTRCQRMGGKSVPLRYNYDKPEKPRISRVFGYLARFFILFQTEKSSREVVIS